MGADSRRSFLRVSLPWRIAHLRQTLVHVSCHEEQRLSAYVGGGWVRNLTARREKTFSVGEKLPTSGSPAGERVPAASSPVARGGGARRGCHRGRAPGSRWPLGCPLVEDLFHVESLRAHIEPLRSLVGSLPGITLDVQLHVRATGHCSRLPTGAQRYQASRLPFSPSTAHRWSPPALVATPNRLLLAMRQGNNKTRRASSGSPRNTDS